MTSAARLVLADCEEALQELKDCNADLDVDIGSMRRRRWMALVALLRAVGHVLEKVDGESSPTLQKIIETEWKALKKTKPKPRIFWDFIENERNTVLKQYKFRSDRRASGVAVDSISVLTATGVTTVNADKHGVAECRVLTEAPFLLNVTTLLSLPRRSSGGNRI